MKKKASRSDSFISARSFAFASRRAATWANFSGMAFCAAYFSLFRQVWDIYRGSFSLPAAILVYFFLMAVGITYSRLRMRPALRYARALEAGEAPGPEEAAEAMKSLLAMPFVQSGISMVNWGLAAVLVPALTMGDTIFTSPPEQAAASFLRISSGVLIAGAVACALVFAFAENQVRRVLPLWFPEGRLEIAGRTRRLKLHTRMGVSLVLAGLLPVSLFAALSVNRVRLFLFYDPGDVVWDLTKLALFFLTASLLLTLSVARLYARSVVGPIQRLARTMRRVEKGDLSVRVDVTSNDELGELSENFNKMVEGLRDRERMRAISLELEKGRQIQKDFLPGVLPEAEGWELAADLAPAHEVSGDFYDAFYTSPNLMAVTVGDVCDKGVGSALFMALIRSLLRVYARRRGACDGERSVLDELPMGVDERSVSAASLVNRYIANEHGGLCMFATLFYGVLDISDGTLFYVNAGHEPPVILNGGRVKQALPTSGPAVGVVSGIPYPWRKVVLKPGDLLFCFTDGATEAPDEAGRAFTRERLLAAAQEASGNAAELVRAVRLALARHVGNAPCFDDVTLLALERKPEA